jgi:hypothetical protein
MNWFFSAIMTVVVWSAMIAFALAHPVLGGLFILGAVLVAAR